ncbi:MAG: YlxR family protein [Christensenellaceae bacterium]|jgi:predicted RNA-binding protein YlxR (DUF448 family)|nr:YlxR family protein [Christensenellaceae bacterium]
MRMCVGCREMKPKKELIRVVRGKEGEISLDPRGKAPGRGAYVCFHGDCLKKAEKTRALERALEHPIAPEIYAQLAKEMEGYVPDPKPEGED